MADNQTLTTDESVQAEQEPYWLNRYDRYEVGLRSRRRARILASALAALVAVSVVRWAWVSVALLDADVAAESSWRWLRVAQFVVAIPGVLAGCVAFAYLVPLVREGYTWRRWRQVAWVFLGFVLAWGAVYVAGLIAFR